jgi:hypothetical protein
MCCCVLGVKGGLGCCLCSSIAVTPKSVIDEHVADFDSRRKPTTPDFGVWVEDPKEGTFLVHGVTWLRELL